jgi:MFS transporter, FSR family, fosmidomycin resistance protein
MSTATRPVSALRQGASLAVLGAVSFGHLLNDMMQSLLPALYPLLKSGFGLSFGQIGLIAFTNQVTASILQPVIGSVTDRRPTSWSLPAGMAATLAGLVLLSVAHVYALLLLAVALVGVGSAVFHPESSRVARLASGGRHGLAQSVFQVGGNAGQALGPLLAAFIVLPLGQGSIAWFALAALAGMALLGWVGAWYSRQPARVASARTQAGVAPGRARLAMALLLVLLFSKFFYLASLTSYYTLYQIDRFHVSVRTAQLHLFVFLAAIAAGTLIGGPVGDAIGRRRVIAVSILGVLPFSLALPHLGPFAAAIVTVPIGLLLASAFPAIVVYAQDVMPGRVGMVAGLVFGLAFGLGGVGAAVLGALADRTGIEFVYAVCAWLPALGLAALLLPEDRPGG